LEAFGGIEGGQTAVLNPLKNRWQGHVADRGVALMACAFACDPRAKFHTSGGPRRRPCLGKGRGRRITYNVNNKIYSIACCDMLWHIVYFTCWCNPHLHSMLLIVPCSLVCLNPPVLPVAPLHPQHCLFSWNPLIKVVYLLVKVPDLLVKSLYNFISKIWNSLNHYNYNPNVSHYKLIYFWC
jgi:hypothetical protein